MNFKESIDYLYGLQLFGIKLGLDNMRALQRRLPQLQGPLSCVHVAGTNGKGSVSAMLAEILKEAGLKVGLYTSPHLHCFSERIRINGVPIPQDQIIRLTDQIRSVCDDLPVTFFEATTAMALLAFQEHQVDVAVIETGLGGRLDATNIVDPLLCLITPISYDHSEHLGESLAEIAGEKAGIIKKGVPVVVGPQQEEAMAVIRQAAERVSAEVIACGSDYVSAGNQTNFSVVTGDFRLNNLSCRLEGAYQVENFAQAAVAALQLRQKGFHITTENIRNAGRNIQWPGRLEWFATPGTILLDVAHNRAGVAALGEYLAAKNIARIHLVVGLSGGRDPEQVLKPLEKNAARVYAVPVSFNPSVSPEMLCRWADAQGIDCQAYQNAEDGLAAALKLSTESEPVLVCGSLYLVAELRDKILSGGAAV